MWGDPIDPYFAIAEFDPQHIHDQELGYTPGRAGPLTMHIGAKHRVSGMGGENVRPSGFSAESDLRIGVGANPVIDVLVE